MREREMSTIPDRGERDPQGRMTRVRLRDWHSAPMRAFHLSWAAFFVCFIAWFGLAPLMAIIRDDLKLNAQQIGNLLIASVAITVVARVFIGWVSDRFGPRRTYTALLLLGSLPVMCVGLAHSYQSFLLFRLAIGVVGASFVISQQHTSLMFAPEVVGTANAMTAGWGNMGGGMAQWLMPALAGLFIGLGTDRFMSWRLAMVVPGLAMLVLGVLYYRYGSDTPDERPFVARKGAGAFWQAAGDFRVWTLFVVYGACFGIEVTLDNTAALYFHDRFHLTVLIAGVLAAMSGMMNIFARGMGGAMGDAAGNRWGLGARCRLLAVAVMAEGVALAAFASAATLGGAVPVYLAFGFLVCVACGLTYAVVPLLQPEAMGSAAGIVGAGGNLGALVAGFVFRVQGMTQAHALFLIGIAVVVLAPLALLAGLPMTAARRAPVANPLPESGD